MAGRYFHGIPHQKGNIMNNRRGLTAVLATLITFSLSATPVLLIACLIKRVVVR